VRLSISADLGYRSPVMRTEVKCSRSLNSCRSGTPILRPDSEKAQAATDRFLRLGPYTRVSVAHYIVRAKPKPEGVGELNQKLRDNAFVGLRPFGKALTHSLKRGTSGNQMGQRSGKKRITVRRRWPKQPEAVLDTYFDEITVERVNAGEGWNGLRAFRSSMRTSDGACNPKAGLKISNPNS
jgi:hypothetical protein